MPRPAPTHPLIDTDRLKQMALVFAVGVLALTSWMQASGQPWPWSPRPLRVWMLDIGQGDAFFIEFPTGEEMLIDGGPDDSVLSSVGSVLPPWDRTLDAVLLTHPDADHVTGLISILERYRVGTVYESGVGARTPPATAFVEAVAREGSRRVLLSRGDTLTIGEATLTIVWPDETLDGRFPETRNNFSINLLLEYGATTILFTGDAEADVEAIVGPRVSDIDVLKVGHHGSLTSTSLDFLRRTTPEAAFISMGRDNTYGHPHPTIVRRLIDAGVRMWRADLDGDVLLTSYGGEPAIAPRPLPF